MNNSLTVWCVCVVVTNHLLFLLLFFSLGFLSSRLCWGLLLLFFNRLFLLLLSSRFSSRLGSSGGTRSKLSVNLLGFLEFVFELLSICTPID